MEKKWIKFIGFLFIIIAVLIALLLLTTSDRHPPVTDNSDIRNISITILEHSEIERNNDTMLISYSLLTSPYKDKELRLTKIEVMDLSDGTIISTFEKENLEKISKSDEQFLLSYPIQNFDNSLSITHRLFFISNGRAILPFSVIGGDILLEN